MGDESLLGPPPSTTPGDVAAGLVRAAISMVPVAGGPAVELLSLVLDPALHRRYNRWMERLAEMRIIDEFTGLHLRLLAYLRDPPGWFDTHGISRRSDIVAGSRAQLLEALEVPADVLNRPGKGYSLVFREQEP